MPVISGCFIAADPGAQTARPALFKPKIRIDFHARARSLNAGFTGRELGALLLLDEILRRKIGSTLPGLHYFIYGVVVIAVIPLTPRGLLSYFELLWARWRRK